MLEQAVRDWRFGVCVCVCVLGLVLLFVPYPVSGCMYALKYEGKKLATMSDDNISHE
jgi:hypothetical protein